MVVPVRLALLPSGDGGLSPAPHTPAGGVLRSSINTRAWWFPAALSLWNFLSYSYSCVFNINLSDLPVYRKIL